MYTYISQYEIEIIGAGHGLVLWSADEWKWTNLKESATDNTNMLINNIETVSQMVLL